MSFAQIRECDANGELTRAGGQWSERHVWARIPFALAFCIAVPGFVFGLLVLIAKEPVGLLIAGGALIVIVLAIGGFRKYGYKPRSLVFGREGYIETPYGTADHPEERRWSIGLDQVASIEMRARAQQDVVELFTRDGAMECLARGIPEETARLVSVQLTLALTEMRAAIGGGQKAAASQVVIE